MYKRTKNKFNDANSPKENIYSDIEQIIKQIKVRLFFLNLKTDN